MKKVAIITNIPSPYRVDLFHYMQTHIDDFSFHIIYTNRNEDNRSWNIPEEKFINTHILESRILKIKNKLDTRYIHLPGNIGKVLSEIMPDVVVAMEYNPAALQAMLWVKIHGRKFVHWTDGTLHSERNIGTVQKITRKIITSNADSCIASSTKAKEKLLAWGVPEEKIFISLLTVDISKFQKVDRAPVPGRILYVGSMIPRKGLDLLVDALPYVNCDFELRIVGNGTEEEVQQLKSAAEAKGILDKMIFCGFLQGEALTEEYRKAKVFVLPTREDCFGLVLLEAMCAGVPIVASRYADGAYDTVVEGENGFIADPFHAETFGKTIDRALKAHEQLNSAARSQVEKFDFSSVTAGYIQAIQFVTKKNGLHKDKFDTP